MSFKNEEYIQIQGWMINKLNLKGNDLLVYALIYRYSQDGLHRFYGSLQYLADWTNSTVSGIQNNLKNLLDANLIFKNKLGDSSSSKCEYWVNPSIQHSCNDIQQSYNDIQHSCIDNINNNIIKNNLFISKDINKQPVAIGDKNSYFEKNKKSRSFKVLQTWLTLYVDDFDIREALKSWLSIMYSNKKIANLECLKNKIDFLNNSLDTKEEKLIAIRDATDKIWFTFQYSVDILKKNTYNKMQNIQGDIPLDRREDILDLSDEVF